MATIQDIKRRLRSVGNTRKITRALELVAAATSSIARVIFRVLRTERIRRLMSWTEATGYRPRLRSKQTVRAST